MQKIVQISPYVKFEQLRALEQRIAALEEKIESSNMLSKINAASLPQMNCAGSAQGAGFTLGCSITPLDIESDPTKNVIGKEYFLLECQQSSVPTNKRVNGIYGPEFDFSIVDKVSEYCRTFNIDLKDGPYINYESPKHDISLTFNEIITWIRERLSRPGFENPSYINMMCNFIDNDGNIFNNNINTGVNELQLIHAIHESIKTTSPNSGCGLSFKSHNFNKRFSSPNVRSIANFVKKCISAGIDLNFIGIEHELDVGYPINRDSINENLGILQNTGIPEIHITNMVITDKKATGNITAGLIEEYVDTVGNCEGVSVLSFASPRSIEGLGRTIFDHDMRKTESYEAMRRGFWRLTI